MHRFLIKHAFNLKSASFRLMLQGMRYQTEHPEEIDELRFFAKQGACEEIVSKTEEVKVEKPKAAPEMTPEDDLSTVKGLGKAALDKLAEKGILTKSALGTALLDESKVEELKEILGNKYEKVCEQFLSA